METLFTKASGMVSTCDSPISCWVSLLASIWIFSAFSGCLFCAFSFGIATGQFSAAPEAALSRRSKCNVISCL
jgi:hypothetical protein